MPRLILTRHAKSSWSSPALSDHARPLNKRGIRSATALGVWLAQNGYVPDQVLSSDSTRTRETWAGLARAFERAPDPDWQPALYLAEQETMLQSARDATGHTVMMLGHNPGCACFAAGLVQAAPNHDRFDDYPTAATLVADVDIDIWAKLTWRSAQVIDFVIPEDLGIR